MMAEVIWKDTFRLVILLYGMVWKGLILPQAEVGLDVTCGAPYQPYCSRSAMIFSVLASHLSLIPNNE